MTKLRRWYLYLVCAITIQLVTWALIALLRNLLGPTSSRTAMAIQMAICVVALPVFVGHWLWAQRTARRDPEERHSFPRRLYLYGMLVASLAPAIDAGFQALRAMLYALFSVEPAGQYAWMILPSNRELLISMLPAMVILAAIWAYHWNVRRQDDRVTAESDASTLLRHLYSYGFSAAGLAMTAIAIGAILQWLLGQFFDVTAQESAGLLFGSELSRLGTGLALWLLFWIPAQRAFTEPDRRERESIVRKSYLYVAVFVGALGVIVTLSLLLADLLQRILGVAGDGDLSQALATIIVAGAVWAYHAFVLRQDAMAEDGADQQALVRRIYTYLMAGLGLTAVLIGLGGTVAVLFQGLSRERLDPTMRQILAFVLAALLAGLPVWLWHWIKGQGYARQSAPAGTAERRSFVRRFYLYAFIFFGVLTMLGSVIYIASQVFLLILAERRSFGFLYDIAQALSFTLIAAGLCVYHVARLRADRRQVEAAEAAQRKALQVAVVDAGDGALGLALFHELRAKVPGITVQPVGLTPAAAKAMNGETEATADAARLKGADVIVGPWSMAVPGGHGGIVTPELATAVTASLAQKILLPEPESGYAWAGVEDWRVNRIAEEVVQSIRALSVGEEARGTRRLPVWAIAVIVLVTSCVMITLGSRFLLVYLSGGVPY